MATRKSHITLRVYREGKGFDEESSLDSLADLVKAKGTVVWLDMRSPAKADLRRIADVLDLHPLELESLDHEDDRPRLRQYGDRLSIGFSAVRGARDGDDEACRFVTLHLFAAKPYLVTVAKEEIP